MSDRRMRYPTAFGAWVPGLVLIFLGVVFLVQNYFGVEIHNWWALFILIPALFTFERAYALAQSGHGAEATGPIIGGLVLVTLTGIFLFDLPIGQLWPVLLILAGVGLLFSRRTWSPGP